MKKLLIILICCTVIANNDVLFAQTAINTQNTYHSFYDVYNQYFNNAAYVPSNEEGGIDNRLKRTFRLWGNNLYPGGDFSVAAQAITDYANNYSYQASSYNPNWISLGPFEDPNTPYGWSSGVGQIHRLEFDPNYDGVTNKTLYAGTSFGGLWKSVDDGLNWVSMNTDLQLPQTSVTGIEINPSRPNSIFVSTGDGDGGFALSFANNTGFPNPISTVGVYRTNDGGQNWESINNGLLSNFALGGTIREIRMNPLDTDEIILASSAGIIKTINATSATPTWSIEFTGIGANIDQQFRGIEFKPDNPSIIYASGTDIYKFDGATWSSMTQTYPGLDFAVLNAVDGFVPDRINIAVTPADPNILYAYIHGTIDCQTNLKCNKIFIYVFQNNVWTKLHEDNVTAVNSNYLLTIYNLPIASSPTNPNEFYFGAAQIFGTTDRTNLATNPIHNISGYTSNGFHADVHALRFQPNMAGLFTGTDGGVSYNPSSSTANSSNWIRRYKGLAVSLIWTFDNSEFDHRKIIGKQDLGVGLLDPITNAWSTITGGDGYGTRIDDENPNELYFNTNGGYGKRNFTQPTSTNYYLSEQINLPIDFVENPNKTSVNQSFPMVNHPQTGDLWFGFSELYKRKKERLLLEI